MFYNIAIIYLLNNSHSKRKFYNKLGVQLYKKNNNIHI